MFIFNYRALFACVKDRTCKRIKIPACYFNIFQSILGILLIYEKVSMRKFGMWKHFLIWKKKKHFYLKTAN